MNESAIRVRTGGHIIVNEAAQKIGFEKGYYWPSGAKTDVKHLESVGYCFYSDGIIRDMPHDDSERANVDYREMSVVDFIGTDKPSLPIKVLGREITFKADGSLELACGDAISSEIVQAIIDRRKQVMKAG